jgi:TusE/DsrC/DsvC family sulfur relay protein
MIDKKDIRDISGFITDSSMWSIDFANQVADEFDLNLTEKHWEIINLIRDLYEKTQKVPELRTVLKSVSFKNAEFEIDRKYIYNLFPYGYGQQACKIAGMREPKKLWLDL